MTTAAFQTRSRCRHMKTLADERCGASSTQEMRRIYGCEYEGCSASAVPPRRTCVQNASVYICMYIVYVLRAHVYASLSCADVQDMRRTTAVLAASLHTAARRAIRSSAITASMHHCITASLHPFYFLLPLRTHCISCAPYIPCAHSPHTAHVSL
jgi:hypothetical protein